MPGVKNDHVLLKIQNVKDSHSLIVVSETFESTDITSMNIAKLYFFFT